MTGADDWRASRARYERFMATELGQLYRAYDQATIEYWRRPDSSQRPELEQIAREATNAFVAKLMELANVA
jgi:hypothetical protein